VAHLRPLGLIGIFRSAKGRREKVQFGKVCTTKATDCGAFDRRKSLPGGRSRLYGVILEIEMMQRNALIMSKLFLSRRIFSITLPSEKSVGNFQREKSNVREVWFFISILEILVIERLRPNR